MKPRSKESGPGATSGPSLFFERPRGMLLPPNADPRVVAEMIEKVARKPK